jgi:hypothetical protein
MNNKSKIIKRREMNGIQIAKLFLFKKKIACNIFKKSHKSSLTLPLCFTEVPVPSQEMSGRACMC